MMLLQGIEWQAFVVVESHDGCGAVSHEHVERLRHIIS